MVSLYAVDPVPPEQDKIEIAVEPARYHQCDGYELAFFDIVGEGLHSYRDVTAAALEIITTLELQGKTIQHFNLTSYYVNQSNGGTLMIAMA